MPKSPFTRFANLRFAALRFANLRFAGLLITCLGFTAVACQVFGPRPTAQPFPTQAASQTRPPQQASSPEPSFTPLPTASATAHPNTPTPSLAVRPSTQEILADLGGYPCPDSVFTCVNIDVPLDHFNPSDTRTIQVVFAILQATGDRKGMFVTATGGPGSAGLVSADSYTDAFDANIPMRFDIVFFDQRGIGLSGGLDCANSISEYYQVDVQALTPQQEFELAKASQNFAQSCAQEMGQESWLPFLGTDQAVEDLEVFRRLMSGGAEPEKIWLYGESYGTQYAQTYAAAHPDALAGLILDGVVDMTLSAVDFLSQQAQAMNDVLVMTLEDCQASTACRSDFFNERGGIKRSQTPLQAYDALAASLAESPAPYRFPLPSGERATRIFSLSDLEAVAANQIYSESDRMILMRGLAAAQHGDWVPLARLLYQVLGLDPATLEPHQDPSSSGAMYYAVECRDYNYGPTPAQGSPAQLAEAYLRAGDALDTSRLRLSSVFYGDLPCVFWPDDGSSRDQNGNPAPLKADGIPTLVLVSSADPATPMQNGVDVYRRLADGYLITTQGGPHVTFGWGYSCPDNLVTNFLVSDQPPTERETTCDGYVMDEYTPLAPLDVSAFADPLEAMNSADWEIYLLPEYYYWDQVTPTEVGCPYGGSFAFQPFDQGDAFTFNSCAFTRGFQMTGSGSNDYETGQIVLNVTLGGQVTGDLHYVYESDGSISVTGTYNGSAVDIHE